MSMRLTSWYKIAVPREDLREGRPLDASEFAVHLDQVRLASAPAVYQDPRQFFERTYLTQNLLELGSEVIRRLSGETTETSAVFNMATQFGGGKTHALTLLYHLARLGDKANGLAGVSRLLQKSGLKTVPHAAVAVFVGTEFDAISGRGGGDEPLRKTPWGEVAWQIGGREAFARVAEHDKSGTAPGGDVIKAFLPQNAPCLILMDELMNYITRARKSGGASQLYTFLHNLSEVARSRSDMVLAVSVPASELEMTSEDQQDYERIKKLLNRLGKAILMSVENETAEIIRRRLFEWEEQELWSDGKALVKIKPDAKKTCKAYAEWVQQHRKQLPEWFPVDNAQEYFESTYPFHPTVISVFERKWQALPRFQRTRGVLRMLALWVSHAYSEGFKNNQAEPLLSLGSAPFENSFFRSAMLEQLGNTLLDVAITSDIAGNNQAHSIRLDKESESEQIKKAQLHRKVAATIFFESNGGQSQNKSTLPEIRLATAKPDLDIGNIEAVLDNLTHACYYLSTESNKYKFSVHPNLNKLLSDRRASVQPGEMDNRIQDQIRKVFSKVHNVNMVYFPTKSQQIADQPALTMIVMPYKQSLDEPETRQQIESFTREYGSGARTFKSSLIWCVPDHPGAMLEEARKLLAWEAIQSEQNELKLDKEQKEQLAENLDRAKRDLNESVWRTYKNILYLGKNNTLREIDLGLVHSSQAGAMSFLIMNRLQQDGDITDAVSPRFVERNWPPAFEAWSTLGVRNAFYASPQFPKLLNASAIKTMICRGVSSGTFAYVGKRGEQYEPFEFETAIVEAEIEVSEDAYIIRRETALAYLEKQKQLAERLREEASNTKPPEDEVPQPTTTWPQNTPQVDPVPEALTKPALSSDEPPTQMSWSGDVPVRKWMNFYQKVLAKFATHEGLSLKISFDLKDADGVSEDLKQQTEMALRELQLEGKVDWD